MSQTKNTDNSPKTNSDEIARSIIQPIVDQAAGDSKGGTKPPLHHNNTDSKSAKPDSNLKDEQYMKSSSNRNIVFHPDHPEKIYDLSSTSTAHSHSPDAVTPTDTNNTKSNNTERKDNTTQPNPVKNAKNGNANASNNQPKPISNPSNAKSQPKTANNSSSKPKKNSTNAQSTEAQPLTKDNRDLSKDTNKAYRSSSSLKSQPIPLTREQRRERRRKLEDPNCFPKRFEVQVQARVRVEKDLSSQHLTDLPEGSVVTVEEIVNRRARISRPLCGWLSVTSKFGARIILPTNSKYSKIGGKVKFQRPIQGQQVLSNGRYPSQAKIVDYNEENSMYKVSYEDGNTQWIDIEADTVQFVSQHKAVKVQKPLDGTAPTFTLQTSQAFFNQFFCKDYPQYQAQSSSTTRHMDISPVAQLNNQSRFSRYPPPQTHPTHPSHNHGPAQGYPNPNVHGRDPNIPPHMPPGHGRPPPGVLPPQGMHGRGHPQHPQGVPPRGYPPRGYPPQGPYPQGVPHPRGRPPHMHPPMGPNGVPHPHAPPRGYPPQGPPRGYPPQGLPPVPSDRYNGHANGTRDPKGLPKTMKDKSATNEEFVNKVKEIERRIIQHLHQRGYDESHPDYHRYLQKAKELAIQKAGKEREKMLQQQRERAAAQQNKGVTRQEYEQYLRYRQAKQRQHEIAEQQRKQRIAEQQAAQAKTQNAAAQGKLTSPSKSSGSVKGLIVLRGLPGSGKTTLAKKLAQRSKNARICTEDRYHWSGKEDGVGEYKFQPQLVFLAREWCTKEIRECIQNNVNLIILDNHNARISMYEDHIQYAVEHGYRFRIIEFVATASLIDRYRARSYKKFPREVYVKLLKLWEHDPRTELINPTFGDKIKESSKDAQENDKNEESDGMDDMSKAANAGTEPEND